MKKVLMALFMSLLVGALWADTKDEKPLLTIGCLSDVHCMNNMITPPSGELSDIFVRSSMTKVLERMKVEDNVDVIVLGGDCQSDKTIDEGNAMMVRHRIAQATRGFFPEGKAQNVIWVTGNHDWEVANFDALPKPYLAGDFYRFPMKEDIGILPEGDAFYEKANNGSLGQVELLAAYHYVLYGFDFVVLNCGKNFFASAWDYTYSPESAQWVADKLDEIYAEDPNKTVFFCLHIPFPDSNSLNSGKGMKDTGANGAYQILKRAFCQYPNLIMLYGHDHGKDSAYTRTKTSQRVTLYNKKGEVIPSTDATHFDGDEQEGGNNNTTVDNFTGKFTIYSQSAGQYLVIDTNNLGLGADEWEYTVNGTNGEFTVNTTYNNGTATAFHIGSNGRFSRGDASTILLYNAEGQRVTKVESEQQYYIVSLYSGSYYAMKADVYSSGSTGQRMASSVVTLSEDLSTLTVPGAEYAWTFKGKGDVKPEPQPQADELTNVYIKSKSGKYFGIAGDVAVLDEGYAFCFQPITGQENAYSLCDATKSYWVNTGSNGYLSKADISQTNNIRNYYFYEATTTAEAVTGKLVAKPEIGKDYVIVVKNINSGSNAGLYAIYCSLANGRTDRFDVVKLSADNSVIPADFTLTSDMVSSNGPIDFSKVVWTLESAKKGEVGPEPTPSSDDPSFFSAFMGSLRYYYNTIDTGDPVDSPTVVQALLVYVYPDRVVLEMKNYNQTGLLKGIQINEKLATYTSMREVTHSKEVTYEKGEPTPEPKEPDPVPAPEFPLENHAYAIKNVETGLYLNLVNDAAKGTVLGKKPEALYFTWKNKGFHITNEGGLYVGGHSNSWNMSSSIPEVWTVETVEGGYAFKCTTAGKGQCIGFDETTVGSPAYRDKYPATEHGVFVIEDYDKAVGVKVVDSYIETVPSCMYDLQGRRVNTNKGMANTRGILLYRNHKMVK